MFDRRRSFSAQVLFDLPLNINKIVQKSSHGRIVHVNRCVHVVFTEDVKVAHSFVIDEKVDRIGARVRVVQWDEKFTAT